MFDPVIEVLQRERIRIVKEIERLDKWIQSHQYHQIKVRRKKKRFYYCEMKDGKEQYISVSNKKYLRDCIITNYAMRLKPQLETDLHEIDTMLQAYHPEKRCELYSKMSDGRKAFVTPLYSSIEDQLAAFTSVEIPPFEYPGSVAPYRTLAGEMVRSKSELFIADALFRSSVPYHYEEEIILDGIKIHPDFIVMNPRTGQKFIWEHFGRMGDPKYASDAIAKINRYVLNGIVPGERMISTFEAEGMPLNPDVVRSIIERFLT